MDEDFFADLGLEGINSVEALEKQVKENLTVQKEQADRLKSIMKYQSVY